MQIIQMAVVMKFHPGTDAAVWLPAAVERWRQDRLLSHVKRNGRNGSIPVTGTTHASPTQLRLIFGLPFAAGHWMLANEYKQVSGKASKPKLVQLIGFLELIKTSVRLVTKGLWDNPASERIRIAE
jgi:hypothetical protein